MSVKRLLGGGAEGAGGGAGVNSLTDSDATKTKVGSVAQSALAKRLFLPEGPSTNILRILGDCPRAGVLRQIPSLAGAQSIINAELFEWCLNVLPQFKRHEKMLMARAIEAQQANQPILRTLTDWAQTQMSDWKYSDICAETRRLHGSIYCFSFFEALDAQIQRHKDYATRILALSMKTIIVNRRGIELTIPTEDVIEIRAWLNDPANQERVQSIGVIDLTGKELSVLPDELNLFTGLYELDVSESDQINFEGLAEGERLILKSNFKTIVLFLSNKLLKGFDLRGRSLTEVDLRGASGLKVLELGGNYLRKIDLRGASDLEVLGLTKNELVKVDLRGASGLKVLNLSENKLSEVDLRGVPGLKVLDLDRNQIEQLDLSHSAQLEKLSLKSNQLVELDVGEASGLKVLDLCNNKLQRITLKGASALEKLAVDENKLTTVPSLDNPELLTMLFLYGNPLEEMPPLLDFPNLKALCLNTKGIRPEGIPADCEVYQGNFGLSLQKFFEV